MYRISLLEKFNIKSATLGTRCPYLEPADALVDEVVGKEVLRDGTLLELFRELGVGESLLPQDKLVGSEPHRRLPVRQVPVLQNKTHFSVL